MSARRLDAGSSLLLNDPKNSSYQLALPPFTSARHSLPHALSACTAPLMSLKLPYHTPHANQPTTHSKHQSTAQQPGQDTRNVACAHARSSRKPRTRARVRNATTIELGSVYDESVRRPRTTNPTKTCRDRAISGLAGTPFQGTGSYERV